MKWLIQWFQKERLISKLNRLFKRRQFEAVIDLASKNISSHPASRELYTFLIWSYLETAQFEKAGATAELALTSFSDHPVFLALNGEILYRLENYASAQEALEKALVHSPGNLQVEYLLGLTFVAQGQLEKASEYFESILRYDPSLLNTRLLTMAEHYIFLAGKSS